MAAGWSGVWREFARSANSLFVFAVSALTFCPTGPAQGQHSGYGLWHCRFVCQLEAAVACRVAISLSLQADACMCTSSESFARAVGGEGQFWAFGHCVARPWLARCKRAQGGATLTSPFAILSFRFCVVGWLFTAAMADCAAVVGVRKCRVLWRAWCR